MKALIELNESFKSYSELPITKGSMINVQTATFFEHKVPDGYSSLLTQFDESAKEVSYRTENLSVIKITCSDLNIAKEKMKVYLF
jgi:hypothetical protein